VNSEITDRDVSALPGSFVSGYRTRKFPVGRHRAGPR